MPLVQSALGVLHVAGGCLEDNPYSTDGGEEGPRNGAERVEIAAIDDPACKINCQGSDRCLYKR